MDIRNQKELISFARQRLEAAPRSRTIAAIFVSVVIGLSLLSALVDYVLGLQIDQSGGLSNMGTRSILSALQTMLPLVQSAIVMCIELGYMAAMLRVARGQYVSPQTLRLGFDRFWVLLRWTILQNLIFMGMGFASVYFGVMIFMLTPLSQPVMELLVPLVSQSTLLDPSVMVPDSLYDPLMSAMAPAFLICGVIYLIAVLPVMYRLRMGSYVIIDKPALGAFAAMGESRKMTHRRCMSLFKLDLHLWWYYAAGLAASVICYGDQLLPLVGIELPFSSEVSFFLFYALYWALEFLIFYFLRNQVEVAYALAYDSLRPKEQPQGGVVLGNIFQM